MAVPTNIRRERALEALSGRAASVRSRCARRVRLPPEYLNELSVQVVDVGTRPGCRRRTCRRRRIRCRRVSASGRMSTVRRSGRSLMNSTASNATTLMIAEMRKIWPVASPYAARMISSMGAGMAAMSRLPPAAAAPDGDAGLGQSSAASSVTRLARTAPSTETPIAPPNERKNARRRWPRRCPWRDGVLDGQHQVLHQHAHAEADDGGVDPGQPQFGGVVHGAGEPEAADQQDGAADEVPFHLPCG